MSINIKQIFMIPSVFENKNYSQNTNGFVLLMSVIFLSIIGIAIIASYSLLGLGNNLSTSVFSDELAAKYLTDSCAEKALLLIKQDSLYSGSEQIIFSQGQCEVLPVEQNSNVYIIRVQALVGQVTRRSVINAIREEGGSLSIVSWVDTANF